MKRFFALLLLAAMLWVSAAASASSVDLTAMTEGELQALRNEILVELANRQKGTATSVGPYTVTFKGAELMRDDEGGDCLVVTVEWSHQIDEPQTFYWSFSYYAFQDGIEIAEPEAGISMPLNTQDTRIKAGATLETQIAYALRNTATPVEIEISEYLGDTNDKAEMTFDLHALGGAEISERPAEDEKPVKPSTGGPTVIGKPAR